MPVAIAEQGNVFHPAGEVPIELQTGRVALGNFMGVGGMTVQVRHWSPANTQDRRHDVTVGMAHGWCGPQDAYDPLGRALARRGVSAFSFDDSRSFGWLGDFDPRNYKHVANVSSKVAWTAIKLVDSLTQQDNRVVMYGHSLGGQTATNVAAFNPDKVEGIIVDGSCGAEDHTFSDSLNRTTEFGQGELRHRAGDLLLHSPPLLLPHLAWHILRNPLRTLAEGVDAGSTHLRDRWQHLGVVGVSKAAVQSARDIYSPVDAVQRDNSDVLDVIHRRQDPESGHLAPQLDPEGTADIIVEILDEWYTAPVESSLPLAA